MFGEGARWQTHADADLGLLWVLLPRRGEVAGMVWFHSAAALQWCAQCAGMVHTGLGFVDAIAIVEQAATNALDARSAALKL